MQTIAHDNPLAGTHRIDRTSSRRGALWTGRVLSGLAILFLGFDSLGKLLRVQPVIDGTIELGYPGELVFSFGLLLFCCLVLYAVPRTSVIGAVLLTGYLGGAVATHVRVGSPLFSHVLFPTYVAALCWGGLMLRDPRLCVLLPWHARE
jgi:hypothetical protein